MACRLSAAGITGQHGDYQHYEKGCEKKNGTDRGLRRLMGFLEQFLRPQAEKDCRPPARNASIQPPAGIPPRSQPDRLPAGGDRAARAVVRKTRPAGIRLLLNSAAKERPSEKSSAKMATVTNRVCRPRPAPPPRSFPDFRARTRTASIIPPPAGLSPLEITAVTLKARSRQAARPAALRPAPGPEVDEAIGRCEEGAAYPRSYLLFWSGDSA